MSASTPKHELRVVPETSPQQPLDIHERRTLGGPDGVEQRQTVDCARRGASVDVHDCAHCGHGTVMWTMKGHAARAECSHPRTHLLEPRMVEVDADTLVKSVIAARVLCVRTDASLDSIATMFLEDGLTAVPVTDADGRPIGLVSKTDLLRELRDRAELPETPMPIDLPHGFHVDAGATLTAGDVMTPLVFAVLENATLAQAIPLMAYEGVHHAPVVTGDGSVVGVLSSMDVLRWLAAALRR